MTLVEICAGTAPGSRASTFLGINSISFDNRADQNTTAAALMAEFLGNERVKAPIVYFTYYLSLFIIIECGA